MAEGGTVLASLGTGGAVGTKGCRFCRAYVLAAHLVAEGGTVLACLGTGGAV